MLDRDELIAAYEVDDRGAPRLRMNFVSSLDGAATYAGRSGGLGNADDQQVMGVLRMLSDVLVVGAGTVRAEGYGGVRVSDEDSAWRVDHGLTPQPRLAVVSSALDLDPAHPLFAEAITPPVVVTHSDAPSDRLSDLRQVAEVVVIGSNVVDLRVALDALAQRGLTQVLCEGGPSLFGDLLAVDVVDELCLSLSALLVGGDAGRIVRGVPELMRRMRLVHAIPTDDVLFLRYERARG